MSAGKHDSSAYTTTITGAGVHIAGTWPVNLSIPVIGIVTARIAAYVDGAPGDGFAVELSASYRVTGGALSIGPVATPLPLYAFGSAAGVTTNLDVSGELITLIIDGVDGITFDVDTRWESWSTA